MRARPEDAASLACLHAACFAKGWPESDFADHIARDRVWRTDDCVLVIREGGGQAEVLTLGVHPRARGRGVAERMMRHALSEIESDVLFLEVAEDNAPALALYRKLGFAPFGRRPNYYRREGGRVAAVTMELRLRDVKVERAPAAR